MKRTFAQLPAGADDSEPFAAIERHMVTFAAVGNDSHRNAATPLARAAEAARVERVPAYGW